MEERCIARGDAAYPPAFYNLHRPPACIYLKGNLPEPAIPSVAIIGARHCSDYGRQMARWYGGELARAGVQIISGMARGVDGVAQRAALAAGGRSFGVLGCGTAVCYPPENRDLYEQLPAQGGLLSEFPADSPPAAFHFPIRNRLISALCQAVLVVEARERSGTLITVDCALEQGREVYVLPGRITDALSGGCNRLLLQGAGLTLQPEDLLLSLEALCGSSRETWRKQTAPEDSILPQAGAAAICEFSAKERRVLACIGDRSRSLQEIYDALERKEGRETGGSKIPLPELLEMLTKLCLKKAVIQHSGMYSRAFLDKK